MQVTVTNYRFPFKEDLGIWTIIWDELGGSEGYVRLQATIIPNFEKLLDILVDKKYINKRNPHNKRGAAKKQLPLLAFIETVHH